MCRLAAQIAVGHSGGKGPSRVGGAASGVVVAGMTGAADCGAALVNTGSSVKGAAVEGGGGGRVVLCCGVAVIRNLAGDAVAGLAGGDVWAKGEEACVVLGGGEEGGGTAWKAYNLAALLQATRSVRWQEALMVLQLLSMAAVRTTDQRTWRRRPRGWCWRGRRCRGRCYGLPGRWRRGWRWRGCTEQRVFGIVFKSDSL